jgi:hypothetical protein
MYIDENGQLDSGAAVRYGGGGGGTVDLGEPGPFPVG